MTLSTQAGGSVLVLGIGCARGTSVGLLERGIDKTLADHLLAASAVGALATIDSKQNEAGLLALSNRRGWPLTFFSAAQLAAAARGSQRGSERVRARVGTPAVAEPAALLLAEADQLLIEKTVYRELGAQGSMTIAVAQRRQRADG